MVNTLTLDSMSQPSIPNQNLGESTSMNHPIYKVVCNNASGNLLLSDEVPQLEIWRAINVQNPTITISTFNSSHNTSSIRVTVNLNIGNPVEFTVPPGNTLSSTVDNAQSIHVFRIGTGKTEGKFCLDVCFMVSYYQSPEEGEVVAPPEEQPTPDIIEHQNPKPKSCHCKKDCTENKVMIESQVLPVVKSKSIC